MIAALFVEKDGIYYGLPDVDPWDESRDARLYEGPDPVVAHPPCKVWSQMGHCRPEIKRGADGGCFMRALVAVDTYGGILEHPANTHAWKHFHLPTPLVEGWRRDVLRPGWTAEVDQAWYGHPCNKRTWLYYVGPEPPDLRFGPAPFTGRTVADDGGGGRDQRSRTPIEFRDLLIAAARSARGTYFGRAVEKQNGCIACASLDVHGESMHTHNGIGEHCPRPKIAAFTSYESDPQEYL